jgi:hypothetical protein
MHAHEHAAEGQDTSGKDRRLLRVPALNVGITVV